MLGATPGDETVGEPGAAARVVAARQPLLQVAQVELLLQRVRPPHRVHHAVAVREDEPSFGAHRVLDRRHRGARVVTAVDDLLERPGEAVARCVGQERPARSELDRRGRLVAAAAREQDGGRDERRGTERGGEQDEGGPARRAALPFLVLRYLIWNVVLPVVWFPAMSVASQRNSVVFVTTNDCPGSRGPVESHNVDVLLGFDPSVV